MKTILGVLALLVMFVGYNAMFIVDEGQQALVTQFGEPVRTGINDAGLYFMVPMVQKVHIFDKRILKWDGDPNEIPTKDKKYIWLDSTARWRIVDPLQYMQRMGNYNRAVFVLNDLVNGAVRDFVTKNDLVEIIRSSDWDEKYTMTEEESTQGKRVEIKVGRDRFSKRVRDEVAKVTEDFGIEILDVLVKRINYTTKVRNTVYERMISERNRIATKKRSEGEALKSEILGDMEKKLKEIQSQAYKESQIIRGKADGTATKIYGDAYNKDPEFYAFWKTLDSYKDVLGNNTKLVLQADSPLFGYLKSTTRK